jgi:hypothetical protein
MHSKSYLSAGLVFTLLLAGCGSSQLPGSGQITEGVPVSNQLTQSGLPENAATVLPSSTPGFTPPPTDIPHPTLTPTPVEPAFDPSRVVEITTLDSYQLFSKSRVIYANEDNQITRYYSDLSVEYQKVPEIYYAASVFGSELDPNGDLVPTRTDDYYWIDDFHYDYFSEGNYWLVRVASAKSNQSLMEYYSMSYGFGNNISILKAAHFAGMEVLNTIPVFHFTFSEDDLGPAPEFDKLWANRQIEGNLYISQDGYYPVHYDAKSSADVKTDSPDAEASLGDFVHSESEVMIELVSINQGKGISLPAEAPLNTRVVDEPLPPEAEFANYMVLTNGTTYTYTTPKTVQETMDYYQNLTYPAGWQLGQVISDSSNSAYVTLYKSGTLHSLNISFNQYSGWTEIQVTFFGN